MLFDYDWWRGEGYKRQVDEARFRCTRAKFPNVDVGKVPPDGPAHRFMNELEARTFLYLRDSAVYEVIALVDVTSHVVFECRPVDEAYRSGAFVVAVPFDEIARVEIFAVHPTEKPEDNPMIKGFGSGAGRPARPEDRGS